MRIGLITPGFSASEEDWCIPAVSDLVRVLAERDEVTVFALRYPHRFGTYPVHGATVHPIGGAQRGGLGRLPILLRTLARIRREAGRRRFDVLHALWAHEPGFLAVLASRLTASPAVVSILGGELVDLPEIGYGGGRSRVNRWLIARALAGAARVTVGSRYLKRIAEDRVPGGKLRYQPLGVDTDRFRPGLPGRPSGAETPVADAPRLEGDPRLLNVASLSPVKDHRTLLAAFAILARRQPGARLHLVGNGELRWQIGEVAKELAVADRVRLHGAVDHGRLADFYRQADLAVQSSLFESQGMTALEAAACGCPVVGTRVGVLPELCPPEELAEPGDAHSLARAAGRVLSDPGRRERLVAEQAATVRGFELRPAVDRLRRHYESLAGAREATD